jgi:hypothetical protein
MCGSADAECGPCPEGTVDIAGTGGTGGSGGSGGGSAGGPMVSATGAQDCTGYDVTAATSMDPFYVCRLSVAKGSNADFYSFVAQATDSLGNSLLAEMDFARLPAPGTYSSMDSSSYSQLLVNWQQLSPAATYQAKTTSSRSNGAIELDLVTVETTQDFGYTISGKLTATVPDEATSQSITVSLSF